MNAENKRSARLSIDYGRLRSLVAEMEQGVAATTRYTWLDLAHELLELHDEAVRVRNELDTLAGLLAADSYHAQANHVRERVDSLNDLLNGDDK